MKVFRYPKKESWAEILVRPDANTDHVEAIVRSILERVVAGGDAELRSLTRELDEFDICDLAVSEDEFAASGSRVPADLKAAMRTARSNIEKFHAAQSEPVRTVETMPGVLCWRKSVAIEKVGLYIPAGTAPLLSTVLMLGVPARLAGCKEIIICTPPQPDGTVAAPILYAAKLCGISRVFKIGGAQAIGAMAFGTETISKVDKIFGPGNLFVTCAKQMVSNVVAIDMPAGPSEVAIFADRSCRPSFVAADLLSQAEHGPDSQVVLVSDREDVIESVIAEVKGQIMALPRRDVAAAALSNSKAILVRDPDEAIDLLNQYAAEHLILACQDADRIGESVVNAGSVFLGDYSCESAGDYASGTNHTLPTNGFARSFGGVSLESFIKKITFQKISPEGLRTLGPTIEVLAEAEGLAAHKNAVTIRLNQINESGS